MPSPAVTHDADAQLRSGDIVLFERDCGAMGGPLGWGVCRFAKWAGRYDHVGLVHRNRDGRVNVIEANFNGVVERPLQERAERPHNQRMTVRRVEGVSEAVRAEIDVQLAAMSDDLHQNPTPYKRNLLHFLAAALQPPDKGESVSAATLCHGKRLMMQAVERHATDRATAKRDDTLSQFLRAASLRRVPQMKKEVAFLQQLNRELQLRQVERQSSIVTGLNEVGKKQGYFCSELVVTAWQRAGLVAPFPPATAFGVHDFAPPTTLTSADELRWRSPPLMVGDAHLGPEILYKGAAIDHASPTGPSEGGRVVFTGDSGALVCTSHSVPISGDANLYAGASTALLLDPAARSGGSGHRTIVPSFTPVAGATLQLLKAAPTVRLQRAGQVHIVAAAHRAVRSGEAVALPKVVSMLFSGGAKQLTAAPDHSGYARDQLVRRPDDGLELLVVTRGRVRVAESASATDLTERLYYPGDVIGLDVCLGALTAANVEDPTLVAAPLSTLVSDTDATEVASIPFDSILRHLTDDDCHRLNILARLFNSSRRDMANPGAGGMVHFLDADRFHEVVGLSSAIHSKAQITIAHMLAVAPPLDVTKKPKFSTASVARLLAAVDAMRAATPTHKALVLLPLLERLAALTPEELGPHTLSVDEFNSAVAVSYRNSAGRVNQSPFAVIRETVDPTARYQPQEFLDFVTRGDIAVPEFVLNDLLRLRDAVLSSVDPEAVVASPAVSGEAFARDQRLVIRVLDDLTETFAPLDKTAAAMTRIAKRLMLLTISASVAAAVFYPLEYLQLHRQMSGTRMIGTTLRQLLAHPAYIYRGGAFRFTLLRMWSGAGLHVACLLAVGRHWDNLRTDVEQSLGLPHERYAAMLTVAFVGFLSGVATYPADVVRVRHAATRPIIPSQAVVGQGVTTAEIRKRIFANSGWRGFWRGAAVWSACALPYIGVHWVFYHEVLLPLLVRRAHANSALLDNVSTASWFAPSLPTVRLWKMGIVGSAALLHLAVTHPIESVRLSALNREVSWRHALQLDWAAEEGRPLRFVRRLYSGFPLAIVRAVPSMALSYNLFGLLVSAGAR